MRRPSENSRLLAFAVLALTLGGCSTNGGLFGGRNASSDLRAVEPGEAGAAATPYNAEGLAGYLEMMRLLIEGDPLTQAATYSSVAEAADFAPTTTNRLKHALALAVPGHPGSDPLEAGRRLSALLAAGSALLPEERVLALIQLRDVEQRLILNAAVDNLRAEMTAAIETQDAEAARRIQGLIDENRRLQAALDDATERLGAIANIEQAIQEREDSGN